MEYQTKTDSDNIFIPDYNYFGQDDISHKGKLFKSWESYAQ